MRPEALATRLPVDSDEMGQGVLFVVVIIELHIGCEAVPLIVVSE